MLLSAHPPASELPKLRAVARNPLILFRFRHLNGSSRLFAFLSPPNALPRLFRNAHDPDF